MTMENDARGFEFVRCDIKLEPEDENSNVPAPSNLFEDLATEQDDPNGINGEAEALPGDFLAIEEDESEDIEIEEMKLEPIEIETDPANENEQPVTVVHVNIDVSGPSTVTSGSLPETTGVARKRRAEVEEDWIPEEDNFSDSNYSSDVEDSDPTYVSTSESSDEEELSISEPVLSWKTKNEFFPIPPAPLPNPEQTQVPDDIYEVFKQYIDDDVYKAISFASNLRYFTDTGRDLGTTPDEIRTFFGINIAMSYLRFPRIHMYWEAATRIPLICDQMVRERYFSLRINLKLGDPVESNRDELDRFWKVRPLIDRVKSGCLRHPKPDTVAIGEHFTPYNLVPKVAKRRSRRLPGLKTVVVTAPDGLPMDFLMYEGKSGKLFVEENEDLNLSGRIVMSLTKSLNKGTKVYVSQSLCSVPLLDRLHSERSLRCTGVLGGTRIPQKTKLKSDDKLATEGRGSYHQVVRSDEQMAIVKWSDHTSVVVASTHEGAFPMGTFRKWSREVKREVDIARPPAVTNYFAAASSVTTFNRKFNQFPMSGRTSSWTVRIIFHLVDLAIVAALLAFRRRSENQIDMFEFRRRLSEKLIYAPSSAIPVVYEANMTKRKILPQPPRELRTLMVLHMPFIPNDGGSHRCRRKGCKSKAGRVQCSTCKMFLCLTKNRNCFKMYHES